MSGWISTIHVKEGQKVEQGTLLMTFESMKMQIPIESPLSGVIQSILVQEEEVVEEGRVLVIID